MTRLILIAGLALIAPAALAQEPNLSFSQKVQIYRACKPDLDRHCPDAGRDSTRVNACLRANQNRLASGCVTTIREAGFR
ncbi:hypothetical protein E8L99_23225 [Phreatobacter aquaticus]|uniref:Cysteine rich repeat-containing protein n=1 Tax=Phreatobacter aquaticus TaxID=2570229 RepID=A0A4D7QL60_9HYPH|nr:cysteine rich repeat-containing protein [Phreatobacter aquaticus]QCK88460.1 hypothetical protein E8L99_23225 [Phreatobacter aquaticus]